MKKGESKRFQRIVCEQLCNSSLLYIVLDSRGLKNVKKIKKGYTFTLHFLFMNLLELAYLLNVYICSKCICSKQYHVTHFSWIVYRMAC